ncbi:hypothetical protein K502DRAFT_324316 [Neoconidiobolus thromboides FSU 785]|nr:hypothetical protein K502DRAFT_324316 [Neoconidiobolus thromboides FSU 785]
MNTKNSNKNQHQIKNNESQIVWIWKENAKKIEVKFDKPIQDIYPLGYEYGINDGCLIVFKDGQIKLYNSLLSKVIVELDIKDKIVWSDSCDIKKAEFLTNSLSMEFNSYLFLLTNHNDNECINIIGINNVNNRIDLKLIGQSELNLKSTLSKSITFDYSSGRLSILDNNFNLNCFQLSINDNINNNELPISLNNLNILNLKLQNIQPDKSIVSGLITSLPPITFLSKDHLLMLGYDIDEDSNTIKSKLILWDIQLSVVVYETYISEINSVNFSNKGKKSHFHCQLGKINHKNMIISSLDYRSLPSTSFKTAELFQSSVEIVLTPFICPANSNLLSSMNRLNITFKYLQSKNTNESIQLVYPPNFIPITVIDSNLCQISYPEDLILKLTQQIETSDNIELTFLNHLQYFSFDKNDTNKKSIKSILNEKNELLIKSKDNESTFYLGEYKDNQSKIEDTVLSYKEYLNKYRNNWYIIKDHHYFEEITSSYQDENTILNLLPPRYISSLIEKMSLKQNNQVDFENYSPKIMFQLIYGSKITSSTFKTNYGGLLPYLIERQDWFNIQYSLLSVKDISEEEIVILLKAIHEIYLEEKEKKIETIEKLNLILETYLMKILEFNFDSKLLIFSLKYLNDKEVFNYLSLLSDLLKRNGTNINMLWSPSTSFIKIYELFTAILDVHFTTIVSSPQFTHLLFKTQKMVRSRLNNLKSFIGFEPIAMLYHHENQSLLETNNKENKKNIKINKNKDTKLNGIDKLIENQQPVTKRFKKVENNNNNKYQIEMYRLI